MKILLFLAMLLSHLSTHAILVQGRVIDAESKASLEGVNIVLFQADSVPVSYATTQKEGFFSVQAPTPGNYYLVFSCIGYTSSTIVTNNIQEKTDLKDIELSLSNYILEEVTVSANNHTKIDRQITFPSAQQIAHSFNGLDVLSKIALPGIRVNPIENTISPINNRPIQLRINDIVATIDDVLAINPQYILKIEYIDLPSLRYGDVGAVVNFVLRKKEKGVSTGGNTRTALTTYYTDNSIYLKYNNKLSEVGLTYRYTHSNYRNYYKEELQTFQLPQSILTLQKDGYKGPSRNNLHNIALSYNWNNNENTILNFIVRNNIESPSISVNQSVHDELNKVEYNSFLKTRDKTYISSLDMYFQYSISEKQAIIANVLASYISSDYKRMYQEFREDDQLKSDFSYSTDGTKYSLLGELLYENKLMRYLTFTSGIKYAQTHTENTYNQRSEETINTMKTSDIQAYAQLQGSVDKFNYQLSAGYSKQYFSESTGTYTHYLFRPKVTLSYSPQENTTFRYNFYLMSAIPNLADLSDFKQWQNEYEVFAGNPNLKPFNSYANYLSFNYRKGMLSVFPTLYYQYNHKPTMNVIDRQEEEGHYYFVYSNENQKSYRHFQACLYVTLALIKDRLSITGFGVLNRYFNFGNTYTHCYTNNFGGLQLEGSYKNWSLFSSATLQSKMLVGEMLYIYSPTSNVGIRYRQKNVQYGIEAMNLFLPNGNPAKQEVISNYVHKESGTYTKDQGNMIRFTVAWNLAFGRKYDTGQKKIINYDNTDSGIIK